MTEEFKLPELYITPEHECSYLPDKHASTLFVNPQARKNNFLYSYLSSKGFRRSGEQLYMPYCTHCQACIPVRIRVMEFKPDRNQRRVLKKNSDLDISIEAVEFRDDEYELYCRYLENRHTGSAMCNPSPEDYLSFLDSSWSNTRFHRFTLNDRLIAVAVVDYLNDALSAVYTFFDPEYSARSPGKYAILHSVNIAGKLGLKWLYLGYWIEKCSKMNYKNRFQGIEYYYRQGWTSRAPGTKE